MAEDGDFKVAGAYIETYLKDSTDADLAKIKAKLEKDKGATIKVGLDSASSKQAGVDLRASAKAIGEGAPVTLKVNVDKSSLDKVQADVASTSSKSGTSGGSLMAAAIGASVLAGGPLIGGAVVGIGVGALAALGVELEKGNPAIKAGWDKLATDAKAGASGAATSIVPPVANALKQLDTLVTAQEPTLRSLFTSAASDITPLTDGVVGLANNALPGLDSAMSRSTPIAQGLAQVERDIGSAVGATATAVATSSGQMGSDLSKVGTTVKETGTGLGSLVSISTGLATGALPVLNAALAGTDNVLTGVHSILGPLEPLIGGVALAGVAGWKILPPVLNAASTASKAVSGGILNMAANMEASAPQMANMAMGAASVVESLGPVGLLGVLGVVGIAVAALGKEQQKEAQVAQDQASAALQVAHALESQNGAVTAQTRSQTASTLQGDSWVQAMTSQGVSLRDITNAALGVPGALQKVQTQVNSLSNAHSAADNILKAVSLGFVSNGDAANKAKDALGVLDGVSGQAAKDSKDLAGASNASAAAFGQQAGQAATVQSVLNSYGNTVAKQVTTFNSATSGIKSMTDATVSANSTFFQDQQGFAQLDAAVTSAAQARTQAAQGITSADNGIRQASQGVASALHSEEQATEAVTTARQGVVTAERAVTAADQSYIASLAAERTAQAALSAARKQAVIDLQNLQRQVTDQGDSESEAQVRLLDATNAVIAAGLSGKTLASLGPLTTGNEANFQLLLAEQEAQHGLNDATAQAQQLAAQNAAQQKAGVAGAAGVVSATQAVTQAQQQDKASAQSLADSKAAVTKASAAVKDAQYQEQQAHLATQNAQEAERQAQTQLTTAKQAAQAAVVALQVAKDADSRSTDINTAAGAANFTKIEDLFEANLSATGSVAAATSATVAQGKSMHITAGNVQEVISRVTGLNGTTARFGVVGEPSVDMSALINAAAKQGLNPRQLGFTSAQVGNARASGSGIFPTHADGGEIQGVGGPREDKNLILASPKEFIVNAHDAQANLGLLHAINDGKVRGFASGGVVGGDGAAILGANIELTELGAMFQSAKGAFNQIGVGGLPSLPAKNPAIPSVTGNAAAGSGLRGSRAANEALMQSIWASMFGWTGSMWADTVPLIMQESGFDNTAQNPTSTAYGQFQFLNCVPLTAEILTEEGWKTWDTVQVGDKTLGYNQATGKSEWTPIRAKVVKPPQRVVRMSVGNWSASVTPGHRWMSERRTVVVDAHETLVCPECGANSSKRGPFRSSRAVQTHLGRAHGMCRNDGRIARVEEFVRTDEITKAHRLRVSAEVQDGEGNDQLSDAEVALLGWIVGDGHINHASRTVNVWIYQAKKRFLPVIDALLDGIPHSRYVRDRQPGKLLPAVAWRLSSPYARDLLSRSRLLDGTPDEFVLSLSAKQRQVWLEAVWQAEGWNVQSGENGVVRRFSQNVGPWADAMTLAAYLCGYRPTRHLNNRPNPKHSDNWTVTMGRPWIGGTEIAFEEEGDQAVWCVNTELGTWTMRQGGLPMLTGNSTWPSYGIAKTSDPRQQDIAGGRYIKDRYGNPANALAHERTFNWYDTGGYMLGNPGINLTKKPEMVLDPGMTNTLDTINAAVQAPSRSTANTGKQFTLIQHIYQQPQEDGLVFAARAAANTSWQMMTSVGG